jgi:hypothetical protein
MKQLIFIAVVIMLASCTKQAKPTFATERRNNGHGHNQAEATLAVMGLVHNGDGTFTIDYGVATDAIRVFLRTGDSLYSTGNLYPRNAQEYVPAPVGAFTTWVSGALYQAVVVTGTETRDINGILGTDWIFTYTNIVN